MINDFIVYFLAFLTFIALSFFLVRKAIHKFLDDKTKKISEYFKITNLIKHNSIKFFLDEEEKKKHIEAEIEKIQENAKIKMLDMQKNLKNSLKLQIRKFEIEYHDYLEKSMIQFKNEIVNEVIELITQKLKSHFENNAQMPNIQLVNSLKSQLKSL